MEGVVVKPPDPAVSLYEGKDKVDVVPYMKVRNPDYMRLIYGYDDMVSLGQAVFVRRTSLARPRSVCVSTVWPTRC